MSSLPEYKLTMLGRSGSGKTVYMLAMYQHLQAGVNGLSLRAADSQTDLELTRSLTKLVLDNEWPLGTADIQKPYRFELLIEGQPIAIVDWVDYRGQALESDATEEDYQVLSERLRQSHAVFWMVDLTGIRAEQMRSRSALLRTGVGRLAQLSGTALREAGVPKSWIFMRTKSDSVRPTDDSTPDWGRAADELAEHVRETAIAHFGRDSLITFLPVSAAGRVGEGKQLFGDDPTFVEWPVLQAVADLMSVRAEKVRERIGELAAALPSPQDPTLLTGMLHWIFGNQQEYPAVASREELRQLSAQAGYLSAVARRLVHKRPQQVRQMRAGTR